MTLISDTFLALVPVVVVAVAAAAETEAVVGAGEEVVPDVVVACFFGLIAFPMLLLICDGTN